MDIKKLLLFLLLVSPAQAITYIQAFHNRSLTSITVTGITNGNTLVVAETGGNQLTGVSDGSGNNWQHVANSLGVNTGGGFNSDAWYADNVTGGTVVISFTFTSGATPDQDVIEFSGLNHGTPVYGGNHVDNQNGTTDSLSPNLTVYGVADMMFVINEASGNSGFNAPWTAIGINGEGYYVPGVLGTYNVNNTFAGNLCSSGFVMRSTGSNGLSGKTTLTGKSVLQ